jgi:hypothetical protein
MWRGVRCRLRRNMSLNGLVDDIREETIFLDIKIEDLEQALNEAQERRKELEQIFEALSIP